MISKLQVALTSVETVMFDRIRDHFDMPAAIIVRLWIREKYAQLYDDEAQLSPEALDGMRNATSTAKRAVR